MTGLIRMVPDDVRGMAQKVDLTAGELYNKPSTLRSLATSLQSNWQGGKAARYADKLRQLAGRLHGETINLQRLARQVRAEVDQWEEADRPYGDGVPLSIPTSIAITVGEGIRESNSSGIDYDIVSYICEMGGLGVLAIKGGGKAAEMVALGMTNGAFGGTFSHIPGLNLAGIIIDAGGMIVDDLQRYDDERERMAAIFLDILFAVFFYAVSKVGDNYIMYAVSALCATGVGVIAGVLAGIGLWLIKTVVVHVLKDMFANSEIKTAMVKALAGTR